MNTLFVYVALAALLSGLGAIFYSFLKIRRNRLDGSIMPLFIALYGVTALILGTRLMYNPGELSPMFCLLVFAIIISCVIADAKQNEGAY